MTIPLRTLCLGLISVLLPMLQLGTAAAVAPEVSASPRPKATAIAPAAPASTPQPPAGPPERQPYRIEVHLAVDPETRLDTLRQAELVREWRTLITRFVGPPWDVSFRTTPSPLAGLSIESLTAERCEELGKAFDKVWIIRIGLEPSSGGFLIAGREYDVVTRRLGPVQSKRSVVDAELPRSLLGFSLELFNPVAVISGEEGGKALLTVRGAMLPPASPIGAVSAPGTVFIPLRITTSRDGKPLILRIPFTYLRVESITGAVARCEFVKGISDPLYKGWPRPFSFAAIGIKPGDTPVKLRFVTRKEKMEVPAAGYLVTTRDVPDGAPRDVGVTDRAGRIAIRPQFARGLVMVRLLAGSVEPLFDAPMMAGESTDERVIPVQLLPRAVTLETQLQALRDEVVDMVAIRARLEARMKARLDGEDWEGLAETLKEFQALGSREVPAGRLKSLKEQAQKEQVETKTPILTRTASAKVDELQALIDRYLDDDEYNAYVEALAQGKQGAVDQAKVKEKVSRKNNMAKKVAEEAKAAATPPPLPATPLPAAAPAQPSGSAEEKEATGAKPKPKDQRKKSTFPF